MSDSTKVKMNYAICAPRMYKGRIESLVSKITGFADMITVNTFKNATSNCLEWFQMVYS